MFLKWRKKKITSAKKKKATERFFDEDFDFAEFIKKHGHQIDHMIKKCHWKAQKCGPENFTSVLTDFGLCYTFNSGRKNHPLLKVHRAGVDFGLRLQLNVQQDQYYGMYKNARLDHALKVNFFEKEPPG